MKNIITIILLIISSCQLHSQSIGIGTNAPNPHTILDISSDTLGLLIPRMDFNRRSILSAKILGSGIDTEGLMVYDSSEHKFYFWDQSSFNWKELGDGDQQEISTLGLFGNWLEIEIENGNYSTVDLGPIDNQDIDSLQLEETILSVHINNGNSASIDLASFKQSIDSIRLNGNILEVFIANGDSSSVDLTSLSENGGWGIQGNNGTNNATDFIGTTDLMDLSFRVGNFEKLRLKHEGRLEFKNTGGSILLGINAGNADDHTNNQNTYIGTNAGSKSINAHDNIAIGESSLKLNVYGSNNVSIGKNSLFSNTASNDCIAIGYEAASSITDASQNIAIGSYSLHSNSTGNNNIAIGTNALNFGSNNRDCIAIGYNAMKKGGNEIHNIAIGSESLMNIISGEKNIAMGHQALLNNANGSVNTAIGHAAGINVIHSDSCVFIGVLSNVGQGGPNHNNSVAIGAKSRITASNQVRIGAATMSSIGGYQPWSNLSDSRYKVNVREDIKGLEFILGLRPVTYQVDIGKVNSSLGLESNHKISKYVESGFLAQEVEKLAKGLSFDFSGIDRPQNDKDHYSLRYAIFVVPLVKAVQELAHKNNEITNKYVDLLREVEGIKQELTEIRLLISKNNK